MVQQRPWYVLSITCHAAGLNPCRLQIFRFDGISIAICAGGQTSIAGHVGTVSVFGMLGIARTDIGRGRGDEEGVDGSQEELHCDLASVQRGFGCLLQRRMW